MKRSGRQCLQIGCLWPAAPQRLACARRAAFRAQAGGHRGLRAFPTGSTASEWEKTKSRIWPLLDEYQRSGYHNLIQIARRHNGALLCDGVGLGKTYIGLMVIERLLFERKRVALFVPKPAREDVWEVRLRRYLPEVKGGYSTLRVYNHTDLLRGGEYRDR